MSHHRVLSTPQIAGPLHRLLFVGGAPEKRCGRINTEARWRKSPRSDKRETRAIGDHPPKTGARLFRRISSLLWIVLGGLSVFAGPATPVAPAHSPVWFRCDFEADDWYVAWGERRPDPHVTTVSADPARKFVPLRGKALRVRVDQGGHYGVSLAYRFRKQTGGEPEEVYFRYYLRFADDWRPGRGGKLPGFGGTYGRAGWGGRPVHGDDGWSARGLFRGRPDGRTAIGYYCYHADMKGRYGSHWVWDRDGLGDLENNRWYCIEQYVRLNTPGKNDGILRGWVDGRSAFEKTDIRFRDTNRLKVETVWVNVYYGGLWAAEGDYHLYLDNVVISKNYIGPLNEQK